jgi:hypothetical protein
MNTKQLKIVAGAIVTESNVDKQSKLQILNWIQHEASEVDVMAFLMDGKIQHIKEEAEQVVRDRFATNKLSEGVGRTILGMFLLSPVGWAAYRLIRSMFSKASRKCGTFSIGKQRDICLVRVKLQRAEKMLALFKKEISNCSKAKNPEKCKSKGQQQIDKWSSESNFLKGRIKDIQAGGISQTVAGK